MLLVHGIYRWRRKVVSYRNDYCLSCHTPRLAFQYRTFDVLHIFWIPLIPLGLWKRWHCSACGKNPHENVRTRRSLKWAGVAILVLMTLSGWAVSPDEKPDDVWFIWAMRIGGPIAVVWSIWATVKSPPDVRLKDMLRTVTPIMDSHCPVCRVMLMPEEPAWRCPQCGLARRSLPAA